MTVRVRGKRIPRSDGKIIVELVGAATTGTDSASVARMVAPPGWFEPPQVPEFDETVVVQKGALTVVVEGRPARIAAGETAFVPRFRKVVYRNDGKVACEYLSVCAPAFRPERAHVQAPTVALEVGHPQGQRHGERLAERGREFLDALGLHEAELSLSIVTDRAIRKINKQWREKDAPTDVLSFPGGEMPDVGGPRVIGDVVISLDTAKRQAREFGRPLDEELDRYLAHGILHLLGHDHHRAGEAKRMARLEARLLGRTGMVGTALEVTGSP